MARGLHRGRNMNQQLAPYRIPGVVETKIADNTPAIVSH